MKTVRYCMLMYIFWGSGTAAVAVWALAQPMRSDRRHPVKLFTFLKKSSTIFISWIVGVPEPERALGTSFSATYGPEYV